MKNIVKIVIISCALFTQAMLSAEETIVNDTSQTDAVAVVQPISLTKNPWLWLKKQAKDSPIRTGLFAATGVCFGALLTHSLWPTNPLANFTPEEIATANKTKQLVQVANRKLPIVYHANYNLSFAGAKKALSALDSQKFGRIHNFLIKALGMKKEHFHTPAMATEEELLQVHTKAYLDSLNTPATVAKILESPQIRNLSAFAVRKQLLEPMLLATGGTVLATELALQEGWAINIGGGYHHAKADKGEGFCVFNDIALAIHRVHETHPEHRVLIIDLDAHQGNGHEMICGPDERISIFDIYNQDIYPQDHEAQEFIDFDYGVPSKIKDEEYLKILRTNLPQAIAEFRPNLIIYNAGTDIYEKDPLGYMGVSLAGIIARDEFVFRCALDENIPVVMVLSGGYGKANHSIVSKSIMHLLPMVLKNKE